MINDPIQTQRALLIWQTPLGTGGARERRPVGLLQANGSDVLFSYLEGEPSFVAARQEGFLGYTGLPLDRTDTSNAINILRRRLPPGDRTDFENFLNKFGLSQRQDLSDLSLLAYTGARLVSDSFSIVETFDGFDRPFEYIFDVAGYRRRAQDNPVPEIGAHISFVPEPDNAKDSHAVQVIGSEGQVYGYINRLQSESMTEWLRNGDVNAEVFRVNGRSLYPRLFIKAAINPLNNSAKEFRAA